MLLEELGTDHELVLVDRAVIGQKSNSYLKVNPNGRVPAWVDQDLVVSKAAAIARSGGAPGTFAGTEGFAASTTPWPGPTRPRLSATSYMTGWTDRHRDYTLV
jgi:Glutathione S-transferase, N-terminal domain